MPKKEKETKKKKKETKKPEKKGETKKTSSGSKQKQELALSDAVAPYLPLLKPLGIGPKQIEFYIKLPQIMDAVATHMQALEQRMDQLIGKAPKTTSRLPAGPKPPAPGVSSNSGLTPPPGAAPPLQGPGGQGGGWIEGFIKTPEGVKLVTTIVNAFAGGETAGANTNTMKIAKAIEEQVLKKTLDEIAKATNVSEGFKDGVRKPTD